MNRAIHVAATSLPFLVLFSAAAANAESSKTTDVSPPAPGASVKAPAEPPKKAEAPSKAVATQPKEPEKRLYAQLPKPLDTISCNIADLEKNGYFALTQVTFGRTPDSLGDTLTWTVRVTKPLTYRHAILLLNGLRDARFYVTSAKTRQELHSTLLYYSDRISSGAVDGGLLTVDTKFEVWMPVDELTVRMLKSRQADTLEFRELGQPHRRTP